MPRDKKNFPEGILGIILSPWKRKPSAARPYSVLHWLSTPWRIFVESRLKNPDRWAEYLVKRSGPLTDFSKMNEAAYAFGLYPAQFFWGLKTIGTIRNRFAHSPLKMSFDHIDIKEQIPNLYPKFIFRVLAREGVDRSNRWRFQHSVGNILLTFSVLVERPDINLNLVYPAD